MRLSKPVKRSVHSLWKASGCRPVASSQNVSRSLDQTQRQYAQPSGLKIPTKAAFKPPPPPPKSTEPATVEDGHAPGETEDAAGPFDSFLAKTAQALKSKDATSVQQLYAQYQERGGCMCNYVIPYDERPSQDRRADAIPNEADLGGDGIVMVVHALFKPDGMLDKVCACSGFVVNAQAADGSKQDGEVVITCAHTLEEMLRNIRRADGGESRLSMSYVIASHGQARRVQQILSSMPRSDTIAMQLEPVGEGVPKLKALPLSPFPVHNGTALLTHLFGSSDAPEVIRSQSRLPPSTVDHANREGIESPVRWLDGQAWRRWGAGIMLGYRSYTNIEVEAGIHSSLPHILTSIIPSPGSSGGPLVSAESGAVVGTISGRRMDNRIEGERGWGASSESIFEMFSLPGFVPTSKGDK